MKTLANPNDKNLILERVARLRNDSPHSWGRMSAPQMVCHLCDSFRSKLGGKEVQSRVDLFTRTAMKWFALRAPVPWPHGIKTPPELDQQIGGTPPEYEYYFAGPPAMTQATQRLLLQSKVPLTQMHFDQFY